MYHHHHRSWIGHCMRHLEYQTITPSNPKHTTNTNVRAFRPERTRRQNWDQYRSVCYHHCSVPWGSAIILQAMDNGQPSNFTTDTNVLCPFRPERVNTTPFIHYCHCGVCIWTANICVWNCDLMHTALHASQMAPAFKFKHTTIYITIQMYALYIQGQHDIVP